MRRPATQANEVIGRTGANMVARAASLLLLVDSRASFEIEGEKPPYCRLERWGRAVLQAGKNPLTLDEILRLHTVLIEERDTKCKLTIGIGGSAPRVRGTLHLMAEQRGG